ncbi:hypothetical protein N6W67_04260 [Proteus mirabilis]|nr:hypothetical protein [Proteus mirabilis]UXJ01422.1 hypothetical protein N6W67_04260 [Proteus mirabilis]
MAIWHEAERTGTTTRVEYQDALTFTYDKVGQLVREASARGDYQHHYDVLGINRINRIRVYKTF